MADMIEGNNMFYVSAEENGWFVPWHKKGVAVNKALNSAEAIKMAKQDYLVYQEPVYHKLKSGEFVIVKDSFLNVRDTDESVLGIVGSDYNILQNYQAFEFVDNLLGKTGVTYETAGVLENGKRVWLLARIPEKYQVAGDEIIPYLCFSNSHDGKYAVRACTTAVKVVCNNTVQLAFSTTKRMWSVRHNTNVENKVEEAFRSLGLAQEYYKTLEQESNRLAEIQVDYDELIEELFPIDEENDGKRKQTGVMNLRNEMHKILEFPYLKKFEINDKGSAWGFIDGVSHMVSHTPPARKTSTYEDRKLGRIVCGDGLQLLDKAYELVLKKVA